MSDNSSIEWTDATWPVVAGCDPASPGCDHCYAATLTSGRLRHLPAYAGLAEGGRFNGQVRTLPDRLAWPLHWRKPRKIFVSDMADLFHDKVGASFIADVFAVMALTPQHTYQVLTKRHGRMRSLLNTPEFWYQVGHQARHLGYAYDSAANYFRDGRNIYDLAVWTTLRHLPNVWLGVSVENQRWADIRIPALMETPAAVRFISAEPLLGPVDLSRWLRPVPDCGHVGSEDGTCVHPTAATPECHRWADCPVRAHEDDWFGIDWVIAGGESGPQARPMHPDWPRRLRDECEVAGVAFHFKQWGTYGLLPKTRPDGTYDLADLGVTVADDGTVYQPGDLTYPDGPRYGEAIRARHDKAHLHAMYRVGKKTAGRELNGRTWDEYPAVSP
jgi:protein gp37